MERIIDFHTHMFPDALAARAVAGLSESSDIPAYTNGTVQATRAITARAGITEFVGLNISVSLKQQKNVNNFAISENGNRLHMFGSVHPFAEDRFSELDRIAAAGLSGVKLHNEYQNFDVDDVRVFPMYEKIASLGLICLFHAGADKAYKTPLRCAPHMLKTVRQNFSALKIVAAHLGGYQEYAETAVHTAKSGIWFDTSMFFLFPEGAAEKLIGLIGTERVLFGSDCPWDDPAHGVAFIKGLPLTAREKEHILYNNAANLLKK